MKTSPGWPRVEGTLVVPQGWVLAPGLFREGDAELAGARADGKELPGGRARPVAGQRECGVLAHGARNILLRGPAAEGRRGRKCRTAGGTRDAGPSRAGCRPGQPRSASGAGKGGRATGRVAGTWPPGRARLRGRRAGGWGPRGEGKRIRKCHFLPHPSRAAWPEAARG